jgi:hypothetical protein
MYLFLHVKVLDPPERVFHEVLAAQQLAGSLILGLGAEFGGLPGNIITPAPAVK